MKYCVKCGNEIEEEFTFCPVCGTKAPISSVNSNNNLGIAKSATMSLGDLLTCIRMAANLEKGYYKLCMIRDNIVSNINDLNRRAIEAKRQQIIQPPQPPAEPVNYSDDKYHIDMERDSSSGSPTAEALTAMFLPVVWIAGEKIKKHKEIKKAKEKLKHIYENQYRQYLADKAEFPHKLQAHNAYIQSKANEERTALASIQELYSVKADVEKRMDIAQSHIQTFYSADVLYPKYRGLIPVIMFCEYLESGRCESIKECINTYEEDVKHRDIVTRLENIADAEYAKQQAICELTSSVRQGMSRISSALYDINDQINIANYNLKIQSECQQQMKEDLEAIRWYEDWRFIRSRI